MQLLNKKITITTMTIIMIHCKTKFTVIKRIVTDTYISNPLYWMASLSSIQCSIVKQRLKIFDSKCMNHSMRTISICSSDKCLISSFHIDVDAIIFIKPRDCQILRAFLTYLRMHQLIHVVSSCCSCLSFVYQTSPDPASPL